MRILFLLATVCSVLSAHAFDKAELLCSRAGKNLPLAKTTLATAEEAWYDVQHVGFDISLTNTTTTISGNVITTAKVTVATMPVYAFELDPTLTIDSFKFNSQLYPVGNIQTNGSVRKFTLPSALSQNDVFTAQVFYHGQPPSGSGFFDKGLNAVTAPSGAKLMYTFSDPYTAEDWWPSKQDITDKIDSVDIWVTVDDTLKAGANGLLKAVTPIPGNKERYEWKTRYPIDYYLIAVVVAPYSDYSYYMHYTDGSGDSMLIQNYLYDSLSFMTPLRKANFDTTGLIVDHFSKIFGRYPFDKEKYGHCVAEPLPGGMEHQTMTTLGGSLATTLIAHELGHQWWGNSVTYGSWADIWLSEGFAAYCEQLYVEHFRSVEDAKNHRTGVFNRVMQQPDGTVLCDDTTDVNRIFSSRLTYDKGASVAHMLRYVAPNDNLYFDVLREYQQQFKYGLAKTQDLQSIAEQKYNRDLDTFFNQWIYKEGYPTYSAKWDQVGNTAYVVVEQSTSKPSSVSVFAMPLQLKLKSADGDIVVTVYNNSPWQGYQIPWTNKMTGLEIDPDNHIVNKTGTIKKDPTAGIVTILPEASQIYPNPAVDQWLVERIPAGSSLQLRSVDGRIVWSDVAVTNQLNIPAANLASGMYMLTISKDNMSKNYKLVK